MAVVQGYIQSLLVSQLRSLGLNQHQNDVVVEDVAQRLESVLFHWDDLLFRRTLLVLGTEEASFWEPRSASLEIRSLVVVAIRNSLITDLNASHAYTKALRSAKELLPDERMPWITAEAIRYFQAANLEGGHPRPKYDLFGSLPSRFPNAWHGLALLGGSSNQEIACELPMTDAEPMDVAACRRVVERHTMIESGIDPGIDESLAGILKQIEHRKLDLFFSSSFKGITRNPEKLLAVIDHVLRYSGTVLTPNYLLSPTCVARRNLLLRPAHYLAEIDAQIANPTGLSNRHKDALASLV